MEHYFSKKQTSELNEKEIEITCFGEQFTLISGSGIFSKNKFDSASRLLTENARIKNGSRVLDIGCGYGVVGICLLKRFPDINMVFSDINKRALFLTKKNLKKLGLTGFVKESFLFEKIKDKFDAILSNPPMAAGRDVCYQLISGAYNFLNITGTLQIVARKNKGGAMLAKKMKDTFGNVEDIARKSGFHVYLSTKTE